MELRTLRLVNFRQHEDTRIEFGHGVTGIVGLNGSGKTTLLEAIAWAMYGNHAARGDKDSLRRLAAKARAPVLVELEFRLGAHLYRVARTLSTAELQQDGAVVANSLSAVTEKVQRTLGMTHDEFFSTYFTGQKDLAVMASLGKTERAAFLSRVLGYERLRLAQERVREQRNARAGELKGLEAGLPERAALEAEREQTATRLAAARAAADAGERQRAAATAALEREAPAWKAWSERRERVLSLDGERRMAEHAVEAGRQECQRLDKELAEALQAQTQLRELRSELEPIERLKKELAALEHLQREETARQAETAQREELERAAASMRRRADELADAAATLERREQEARTADERMQLLERQVGEERTAWVRDRQDAETKRLSLREQYREVKEQKDLLERLGPDGTCPTCKRPLGDEYAAVQGLLDRQLEDITINGNFFKQRVEQLAQPPARLRELEGERDAAAADLGRRREEAGRVRAQAAERVRLETEQAAAQARLAELAGRIAARPTGYDGARHDVVRGELRTLEPVALEAAALAARAARAEGLVKEAEQAEQALSGRERHVEQLRAAIAAEGFSEREFQAARERHDRAQHEVRTAELARVEARGELTRAEEDLHRVDTRLRERAARERDIAAMRDQVRLHNELDRAFSDLRAELNGAMRPEIAELASGFMADLTDGRYDEVDLTPEYAVTVIDDGVPKAVISGGEEDLASLVLRLAISQMIAERAGQPLSLLVLDEIFGSLDDARRQQVLGLLRRLGDRFPQVVLITHIEQVRDGLDRVIRVTYDPATGTSRVRDETAVLGATDASVAA